MKAKFQLFVCVCRSQCSGWVQRDSRTLRCPSWLLCSKVTSPQFLHTAHGWQWTSLCFLQLLFLQLHIRLRYRYINNLNKIQCVTLEYEKICCCDCGWFQERMLQRLTSWVWLWPGTEWTSLTVRSLYVDTTGLWVCPSVHQSVSPVLCWMTLQFNRLTLIKLGSLSV